MKEAFEIATISQADVIATINKWKEENSEETLDTVLYFASELTGLSVDALLEML